MLFKAVQPVQCTPLMEVGILGLAKTQGDTSIAKSSD